MSLRRIVLQGTEAREKLAEGARKAAELVRGTMGPFGYNVFLEKRNRPTNDGVSIIKEVFFTDEVENMGAQFLKEAATKTVDEVGDGTTTAITLAWAIYEACSKKLAKVGVMGMAPSILVRQIEKERIEITQKLVEMATPIETEAQLIDSARVAVDDEDLGILIGKAQWNIGKNGFLMAEETSERNSSVESVKGVRIDNGFGTSQIITNQEKQTCEVENTKVILTSHVIRDITDWMKLMKIATELAKTDNDKVVIIARAWTDETINYCLQNLKKPGAMKFFPFNAPYVDLQERMKDLQAVVGGTFYDSENSSLEDMQLSDVGFAASITGRRFDAILTGKESPEMEARVKARIEEIQAKMDGSQSDFEKKQLAERIAQLTNGFALVKIGSSSDMERKRLYDKAEDGVNAVRAAFQEGTVEGAGMAFKKISDSLPDTYILKRPLRVVYEQIQSSAPADFLVEPWVRDPVKVLRIALERACSAASSFATSGGAIVTESQKPLDELLRKVDITNQ